MHFKRQHLLCVILGIALISVGRGDIAQSQINQHGRAMVPADLLTLQSIKETVLSPDGKWTAVVVERPRKPGEAYERGYLGGVERSDVWLASTDGTRLVNLTRGETFHAGYWNPVWSPDSRRLAMLSTRGSDNVRAYVYDVSTKQLRQCSDDGVDLGLRIETSESNTLTMAWLGRSQLLLGVLPGGTRPLAMDEMERTQHISSTALADVKRGRGVTASILDTENAERSAPQKNVTLNLLDLVTNKTRPLTRIPLIETRLSQRVVSISPDRSYAAILATDYPNTVPRDRRPSAEDIALLKLGVANLSTSGPPAWVQSVRPASFTPAIVPTSIRWAPLGSTFAFIGTSIRDEAPAAFTVRAGEKKPEAVAALKYEASDSQLLTAEDVQWSRRGELLVYGYAGIRNNVKAEASLKNVRGFARDNNQETARRDWWIISSPTSYHNLTRDIAQSPRMLFRLRDSNLMFTAGSGRIWSVDASARTTKAINVFGSGSVSIIWPRVADAYRPADRLIVSQATANGADLFSVDLTGREPLKLGAMPQGARFNDYSPQQQLIAYETEVTELRIAGNQKESLTLVSLNRQLDAIAKPQYRSFQYQTAEGKQLSGALLLPYAYSPGRRYPLIVSVYAGSVPPGGNWASPYKARGRIYPDPFVFSGHGYAVLIPSIPLPPMGVQSDPMLELDKGVKPAIDKVIEMGVADPDRIGLVGHSFGGYSVYGLVTQTGRFKAAVAMAGYTDVLSIYGRVDPRHRFSDVPNALWGPFTVEGQQPRMGVPPWDDLERYVRNSPYLHVDKVTTPLLMIHGELDSLPLSEAEQFFVALNRLGKRAKLVRYLGEGHSYESPGNVLDMYEHILKWFDEFLLNRQPNQSANK